MKIKSFNTNLYKKVFHKFNRLEESTFFTDTLQNK